jgi:hypothetical protein
MQARNRIQWRDEQKGASRPEAGEIPTLTEGREEKERTDAKRLRPKADQAVSSVSHVPALVSIIDSRCSTKEN